MITKSKSKLAVCSRSFSNNTTLKKELKKNYSNIKFNNTGELLKNDNLIKFLADCELAIVGLEEINQDILKHLPNLKVISKYGVGLDKIDLMSLIKNNISLGWSPGVNALGVAELALSLSLNIVRKTFESNTLVKSGLWRQVIGKELSSLSVGILGCGRVGGEFLKLITGFNCKVFVCDILDKSKICKKYNAEQVDFETLLKKSNLLSIHIPLNQKTKFIINKNSLKKMKSGSFIINTARGELIDEKSLVDALEKNKIAGAALDVLNEEPPRIDNQLLNHKNCIITSHIGGSSEESILKMGRAAINGLKEFIPPNKIKNIIE